MIYNGKEIEFPAIMHFSLFKLIEKLEEQAQSPDKHLADYARSLLKEVEPFPELREGIADMGKLYQYDKPVQKLGKTLFPELFTTNEIKILTPPFYFEPLLTSQRFDQIVSASGQPFKFTLKNIDADFFYVYCCYYILGSYFHYPVSTSIPQLLEIFNQDQGLMRTYKILINADLSEFIPTEKAVMITPQDYQELIDNFDDMALWKSKFPPDSWINRGINIINLVDVTSDQAVNSITSNLLVKSTDSFEKIQWGIRKLLNKSDLSIGIMALDKNKIIPMKKEGITSLLLGKGDSLDCSKELCDYSYGKLVQQKEPFIVTDVLGFYQQANTELSRKLERSGFRSYMVIPIIHQEEFLGYMELGAKEAYTLHKGIVFLLSNVLPILAMAHKRFLNETQNLIEAIIQQECTTIHSSVKWRFEEEARQFMSQKMKGEQPVFKDIVFNNLFPLYGQVDVKGSSQRRNKAVMADLSRQLEEVIKLLNVAHKHSGMPVLDELSFRASAYQRELTEALSAGSEHRILTFLKGDIYPVFEHLEKKDQDMKKRIQQYRMLLNPELHTIYQERKKYDESINQINQRLASYLDDKQIEAQKIFPHYYERYKTDGVEYNMYIGESIAPDKPFNLLYLKNLRLWQLMVMCEMEYEFQHMQAELNTSIEVASLILAYNTPLSVHFRMDEKQFDVEGAYNARYEIIKKRVDKALIKGTNERITRPGSISIIYSQDQDAREYRTYLDYLVGKGYLKSNFEDLELEDLQGVHGLRALRVEIDYTQQISVNELMKEIKQDVMG
ncbi:MAG: GAF domain-containing protein [Candidatus Cyclobacteriaceae bacterium M3_2C_046]